MRGARAAALAVAAILPAGGADAARPAASAFAPPSTAEAGVATEAARGPAGPLDPALACDAAAAEAAAAEDVPLPLMRAITRAETGHRRDGRWGPWPWTVNMEGEGRWFDGPAELLDWVEAKREAGGRSFDLGCFQVNHLWHGEAFADLPTMLDPRENALYAARFLRTLALEAGSWERAAGWYHSRTPELATRYRGRVLEIRAGLDPAPDPAPASPRTEVAAMSAEAPEPRAPRELPRRPRTRGFAAAAPLLSVAAGPLLGGPAAPTPERFPDLPRDPDAADAPAADARGASARPSASLAAALAAPSTSRAGGLLRRARPLFAPGDPE